MQFTYNRGRKYAYNCHRLTTNNNIENIENEEVEEEEEVALARKKRRLRHSIQFIRDSERAKCI